VAAADLGTACRRAEAHIGAFARCSSTQAVIRSAAGARLALNVDGELGAGLAVGAGRS
jgi:hypothetical protein